MSNPPYKSEERNVRPISRLLVICDKAHSKQDLQRGFQKYGKIVDIWIEKVRSTGENKGMAYIEFSKTSEAALALEEMNGKRLANADRPLKVIVEAKLEGAKGDKHGSPDKYKKLLVIVPKDMTEESLKEEFEKYGSVDSAEIVRDRTTREPKGVASVKFKRFHSAAVAYEKCPAKYKAVFACLEPIVESSSQSQERHENESSTSVPSESNTSSLPSKGSSRGQPSALDVICSKEVNRDQLWRLFDLVPGLDYCQINGEDGPNCEATVIYTNKDSAVSAKRSMNGVEYPPGHNLIVKYADGNLRIADQEPPVPNERGGKRQQLKKTVKLYNDLLQTRLNVEEREKYTTMLEDVRLRLRQEQQTQNALIKKKKKRGGRHVQFSKEARDLHGLINIASGKDKQELSKKLYDLKRKYKLSNKNKKK